MLRLHRFGFFLFGVVPALNAVGLLLFGLYLATSGSGGTERAVPLLLLLAGGLFMSTAVAAVKRGRDLGWKAAASIVGLVLSSALGPMLLIFLGFLAFAPGNTGDNAFGPEPPALPATSWVWAVIVAAVPWFVAVAGARMM